MRISLQNPCAAVESVPEDSTAARSPATPQPPAPEAKRGVLYIVSVPIGHPDDISIRALRILQNVNLIVVEDARLAMDLLQYHNVKPPAMISLRPRLMRAAQAALQTAMQNGQSAALICDAGTPGIADPGQSFVHVALTMGCLVTAIPGPCAALAALSVSGLPTSHFAFDGFPPRDPAARTAFFRELASEPRTILLYESARFLRATLTDLCGAFGPLRSTALCCALTRPMEQIQRGSLKQLLAACEACPPQDDCVLVIGGQSENALVKREK